MSEYNLIQINIQMYMLIDTGSGLIESKGTVGPWWRYTLY